MASLSPDGNNALISTGVLVERLWDHFQQSQSQQDLDWIIALNRVIVDFYTPEHPERVTMIDKLAKSRYARFEGWGDVADLERATVLWRDALRACPEDRGTRLNLLNGLSRAIIARNKCNGKIENLDELIEYQRSALSLLPETYTDRLALMKNLGTSLMDRFKQSWSAEDMNESISVLRAALELQPEGDYDRSSPLFNLAISLHMRFRLSGDVNDLNESIRSHRDTLSLLPDTHPMRSPSSANLAYALRARFEQEGNVGDLDEAILLNRHTLDVCPQSHQDHPFLLSNLADSLHSHFKQGGDADSLEESILLYRGALRLHPERHPDLFAPLHGLGNALVARFGQCGRIDDLDESIQVHRDALNLLLEGHPDRSASLHDLGNALLVRFRQSGGMEDLDEAISLHRASRLLRPEGHPNRSASLHGLGNALLARFKQSGGTGDLDEAISLHHASRLFRPEGHPNRSASPDGFGNALLERFRQSEGIEDLDEAVRLHRNALALRREGHPDLSSSLNNLGNALSERFRQCGGRDDLDEAIMLHRDALRLSPDGHPDRSMLLHSLGNSLMTRFQQSSVAENLEKVLNEIVELQHRAMTFHRQGQRHRSRRLMDRAHSLLRQNVTDDFNEAVALHRTALALCPEGRRAESFIYLADSLMKRFQPERNLYKPSTSIPLFRDVRDICSEDSFLMFGLVRAPSVRFKKPGGGKALKESIQLLRDAANHAFSALLLRLEAAHRWATLARTHGHETTLTAYKTAAMLLSRTLTIGPTLASRHDLLARKKKYSTMSSDAAAYAIEKGNLGAAVEFLEQGRALLWSQMRGLRTPLDGLAAVDNGLADRFKDCCRQLERLMTSPETGRSAYGHGAPRDEILGRVRQLTKEQEAIINEIRQVPGFEDFLQSASFEQLRQVASEGPVVVLNHSEFRCDALIILPQGEKQCVCVPLDKDWFSDARDLCDDLALARHKHRGYSLERDEALRRAMKAIWDRVVSKVVRKLREFGIGEGSRIWWCPTAFLSALPFHAAGPYKDANGVTKYLLDDYISSYTPTLTSLVAARAGIRAGIRAGTEKFLFVGDTSLKSTKGELRNIHNLRRVGKVLLDHKASRDRVLAALRDREWVHFACHGTLDLERPFESSFALPGGKLTLLDIARANFPNAEFAFLSACHTAEQSPAFCADEALHLAAAFHFCGFRSVVGTMWQLLDRDGPILADKVYTYLMGDIGEGEIRFKRAADAVRIAGIHLRESQKEWRDGGTEVDVTAERWVNLVHFGA